MGTPKLHTPRLAVTMLDGATYDVQVINVDLCSWDRDRAKHNWPQGSDAPWIWLNYLAWHALTKTQGILPAMTLRDFEVAAAEVRTADDDGDGDAVDPTNLDPAPE